METELKLAIAAKDIAALKAHQLLAGDAVPETRRQLDVYYDTTTRDLWNRGYGLRVRCADGNYVQTMKDGRADRPSGTGGLHVRREWETPLADGKPDLEALAALASATAGLDGADGADGAGGDDDAGALLRSGIGERLLPVFAITTERTIWNLAPFEGCEVECVLDVGTIRCGKRQMAIAEVELELIDGGAEQLFALAQALGATVALRIENVNKAERGYALLGVSRPLRPARARPLAFRANATLEQAFGQMLHNCLEQVEANVPGVLAQDGECLHQMRVGLRRLRAVLDLFDSKVELPAALQQDIAWLGAALGQARDWDVFMTATLETVGGEAWSEGRLALRGGALPHAAAARKAVRQVLQSQRYTALILGLAGWIAGRQWRMPADGVMPGKLDGPVREAMAPLLGKAVRRLHQRIRKAARDGGHGGHGADPATLHRVRIAAKKCRYAAEFFQPLLPARPLKKQLRRLKALQDLLGSLNDIAVAGELLDRLEQDGHDGRDAGGESGQRGARHEGDAHGARNIHDGHAVHVDSDAHDGGEARDGDAGLRWHIAFARGYLAATAAAKTGALRKPLRRAAALALPLR